MEVDRQLVSKLREGRNRGAFEVSKHKITVQGSSANVSHTINEDERTEFTRHMNAVLGGDPDIGSRLPFPLDTMQIFDECKGWFVECTANVRRIGSIQTYQRLCS
jgi:plastin-1